MSTSLLWNMLAISDTHWNPMSRVPQSRTATFHEDCLTEWKAFQDICHGEHLSGIIHAGDWFHLKNQSLYNPADILLYRDWVLGLHCPVWTVPGNHDLPQSSYDNVGKTAYQTLVHATPNMVDLSFQTEEVPLACSPPCDPDKLPFVSVSGIPYLPLDKLFPALEELDRRLAERVGGINIVILHPDALPRNDFFMFFKTCSWEDLLRKLPHATILVLGHIHNSFPILQTSEFSATGTPQFVCKAWSAGRVVRDYHQGTDVLEHQHQPSYTQIQIGLVDGQLQIFCEYKVIPFVPFAQAFLMETLKREVEKSARVSTFISSLQAQHGSVDQMFSIENPGEYLNRMSVPKEVRELIEHYISQ